MASVRLFTKLKVRFKPVFLDKDALRQLCNIVLKVRETDPSAHVNFEIEGESEQINTDSIDSLVNARIPRNLTGITLRSRSYKTGREIDIRLSDIGSVFTYSDIELGGPEADWVSTRTRELEEFLYDHRSFHWIFQNGWSMLFQMTLLSILLGYTLWNTKWAATVAIVFPLCYLYFMVTRKVFPAVVILPERVSGLVIVRKFLTVVIPTIFVSLVVQLLSRWIWHS